MGLNAVQESAVLTAIEKMVKARLGERRQDADAAMVELYESTGADRMKIKLGDDEIGTLTLTFSKDAYEVTDAEAFHDFMLAQGLASINKEIRPEFMLEAIKRIEDETPGAIRETVVVSKDASKLMKRAGDSFVLEGTEAIIPGIAPKPPEIKDTRLTGCEPEKVVSAMSALPGGVAGVLMGGDGDE